MVGRTENAKRLREAFERSKSAANAILDDPEKTDAITASARDFVEENLNEEALTETAADVLDKGTDMLVDLSDGTTSALEGLAKEDLTPDKLQSIFKEYGKDGVVSAIEGAGQMLLFGAGGPARIATMLASQTGILDISGILGGKPAAEKQTPSTGKAAEEPGFIELILGGQIDEAFDGIMDKISIFDSFKGIILKFTGINMDDYMPTVKTYIELAKNEVSSALGSEFQIASTGDERAPPAQEVVPPAVDIPAPGGH